jgi:hypothetical protein
VRGGADLSQRWSSGRERRRVDRVLLHLPIGRRGEAEGAVDRAATIAAPLAE